MKNGMVELILRDLYFVVTVVRARRFVVNLFFLSEAASEFFLCLKTVLVGIATDVGERVILADFN